MSADEVRIRLEPLAVEVDVPRGAPLIASLAGHGVEFPCGEQAGAAGAACACWPGRCQ